MRINHMISIYLLFILCSGCSSPENKIIGKWDFYDAKPDAFRKDNYQNLDEEGLKKRLWEDVSENTLVLNEDKTFYLKMGIKNQDPIGHWTYNPKDSVVTLAVANNREGTDDDTKLTIKINTLSDNEMSFILSTAPDAVFRESVALTFRRDTTFLSKQEYNFTAYDKNKWLIRARSKETREQILERTRASVEYVIAYMQYNYLLPTTKTISTGSDFQRLRYSSAYGLNMAQTRRWNEHFFDDEDAAISNQMLEDAYTPIIEEINASVTAEEDYNKYRTIPATIEILHKILENLK